MSELIPPRRGEFVTSEGVPTQRFIAWIESLTTQTNSTVLGMANQAYGMFANPKRTDGFEVIEVSGTEHTTAGNEILICINTAELTVTLNPNADHKEQVIIVRQGTGRVKVTAAKLISGKTTKTILRRYSAPHHIFTTEADSWSVI